MKYLYNDKKEFCGISFINFNIKNSTEKPIKFLSFNDKAYFKNGIWDYDFVELKKESIENLYNSILDLWYKLRMECEFEEGTYKKEKSKDISILIPCYKKAEYILETVKSCINQSLMPYQIIVLLMDAESKALKQELENLSDKVFCVSCKKENCVVARNHLVELCQTEYFSFLDADDTLPSNYLEAIYNAEGSIVFVPSYTYDKLDNIFNCKTVWECCSFTNITGLLNKEVYKEIGLNEKYCLGGEDSDFKLRLFSQGKWFVGCEENTHYNYRAEGENKLSTAKAFSESVYNQIKDDRKYILKAIKNNKNCNKDLYKFVKDDDNWTAIKNTLNCFFKIVEYGTVEKIEKYNGFISELKKSQLRDTQNLFDVDNYDYPSDIDIDFYKGYMFDVILLTETYFENIEDKKQYISKNGILDSIDKDLSEYDKLMYLLKNYSCFYYPIIRGN